MVGDQFRDTGALCRYSTKFKLNKTCPTSTRHPSQTVSPHHLRIQSSSLNNVVFLCPHRPSTS
jgi:hypothetical protein